MKILLKIIDALFCCFCKYRLEVVIESGHRQPLWAPDWEEMAGVRKSGDVGPNSEGAAA